MTFFQVIKFVRAQKSNVKNEEMLIVIEDLKLIELTLWTSVPRII